VESFGHSVPNPWNSRMGTWYPLANLLKSILIQLLGMFFLDRSVSCLVSCLSLVDYHALQFQQLMYLPIVCNLNGCSWPLFAFFLLTFFLSDCVCFLYNLLWQQGVLGIKVKIMLDWDPKGKVGPMTPLPDLVTIHPPKEEEEYVPPLLTTNIEIPVA